MNQSWFRVELWENSWKFILHLWVNVLQNSDLCFKEKDEVLNALVTYAVWPKSERVYRGNLFSRFCEDFSSRKNLQWYLLVNGWWKVKHSQEVDFLNFERILLLLLWLFFWRIGIFYSSLLLKSFPAVNGKQCSSFSNILLCCQHYPLHLAHESNSSTH